jgi:hypothetical protein
MKDRIYKVLVKYYGRMYGENLCEVLAEFIAERMNDNSFRTKRDVQTYLHMNTTGGGVAEMAATDIVNEFPMMFRRER